MGTMKAKGYSMKPLLFFSLFNLLSLGANAQGLHTFTSATTISSTQMNDNFAALVTDIASKEPSIITGTSVQYFRGDKTWQTLSSTAVPEGVNLYFTEPRVRATALTGFTSTAGTILGSDTILTALGKLDGNINNMTANFLPLSGGTMAGTLSMGFNKISDVAAPTLTTDAANKDYVDIQIATITSPWTSMGPDIYFSTGRVGIGASTPMAELHLDNATASGTSIALENSFSNTGFKLVANSGAFIIHDSNAILDRVIVDSVGNVGIGTNTPTALFQVGTTGDGSVGVANNWSVFSDERLKKNFVPVSESLSKLKQVSGYYYYWKKSQDTGRKMGLKAQEVEKVFPEIVTTNSDGIKSVSYDHLIAPVIEGIKELHLRVLNLEKPSQPLTRLPASEYQRLKKIEKENEVLKSYLCKKDPQAPFCLK